MIEKERAERLRLEALALRYVFTLPQDERAAAIEKLNAAALVLDRTMDACATEWRDGRRLELPDLEAMRIRRPALRLEDEALLGTLAGEILDPKKGYDPAELAAAYTCALEDTAKAGELRRVEHAEKLLLKARTAKTTLDRRALLDEAARQLERAGRDTEGTLAEVWNAHLDNLRGEAVKPHEAVKLDPRRGPWAEWINAHLGPRGGLTPGRTLLIGGAPAGGKTSLAAALAVDALAVGCPVLFWQLELGREESLEHLLAQYPDAGEPGIPHWKLPFWKRARRPLPEGWGPLLTVPRWPNPDAETLEAALLTQARTTERARRAGKIPHAVNGLVLVDYAQLLTMAARGPKDAGHEILATAASRLAKATAEAGACLVLLSQLNKEAQRQAEAVASTSYAGADIARMVHCAVTICRAAKGKDGPQVAAANEKTLTDPDKGAARWLAWTKTRGELRTPPNYDPPEEERIVWYMNRAWHGGDAPAGGADNWVGDDER